MYKQALTPGSVLNPAKSMGKGLWNMAFGGRNTGGKWDPWHGARTIGRPKQVHTEGPYAGMFKRDATTGEALSAPGKRNFGQFLKDELKGGTATRGDMMARSMARRGGRSPEGYAASLAKSGDPEALKRFQSLPPGEQRRLAMKQKPNIGEFLQNASPAEKAIIQDVNTLGMKQFMEKYPHMKGQYLKGMAGRAGRMGLHQGLLVGLPAYEGYDILANREGMRPDLGPAANIGRTAAAGLGMLGTLPLGWVGAIGAGEMAAKAGQSVGKGIDNMFGWGPLKSQSVVNRMKTLQPLYSQRG